MRGAVRRALGDAAVEGTWQIYDVAHNVAKPERHGGRDVLVHRKGRRGRSLPGTTSSPRPTGRSGRPCSSQCSFVRAGGPGAMERAFGTTCHGAGRALSRELEAAGITVRSASDRRLAEEAPFAYKHVEHVVDVVERAGLAVRVAQLRPVGVVKGRSRYAPATPPGRGDPAGDTRGEFT